jgi:hypothetical protein
VILRMEDTSLSNALFQVLMNRIKDLNSKSYLHHVEFQTWS